MVVAVTQAMTIDLDQYIRAYRIAMLYCATCQNKRNQNQLLTQLKIDMSYTQYLDMVKQLLVNYNKYKNMLHNGYPIKDWCLGLDGTIDLEQPLANRWSSFPLAVRGSINHHLNNFNVKVHNEIYQQNKLSQFLGNKPFINFEQLVSTTKNIDTVVNKNIIDKAYLLFLLNAYLYYHSEQGYDHVHRSYITTDSQWDWLSRKLAEVKHKLDMQEYPVLFDHRFEAGQSLFWLSYKDYPDCIKIN